jgi:hypothetical protein
MTLAPAVLLKISNMLLLNCKAVSRCEGVALQQLHDGFPEPSQLLRIFWRHAVLLPWQIVLW